MYAIRPRKLFALPLYNISMHLLCSPIINPTDVEYNQKIKLMHMMLIICHPD